jgi:hypothetical protein
LRPRSESTRRKRGRKRKRRRRKKRIRALEAPKDTEAGSASAVAGTEMPDSPDEIDQIMNEKYTEYKGRVVPVPESAEDDAELLRRLERVQDDLPQQF